MLHLDKARIWNREIKVSPSKHFVVQMPKEGQPVCRISVSSIKHYLINKLSCIIESISLQIVGNL